MRMLLISISVLLVGVGTSGATTITFDSLEHPGNSYTYMYNMSYSEGGFVLTGSGDLGTPQQLSPAYLGSASLFSILMDGVVTLTSETNSPFTIIAIDLAYFPPFDPGASVTFNGYDAMSNLVATTTYSPVGITWSTVNFGPTFQNISAVSWTQSSPYHQFDNIVLNSESPTATPEPSTMLLMGIGAAGAAFMRRRKMKSAN